MELVFRDGLQQKKIVAVVVVIVVITVNGICCRYCRYFSILESEMAATHTIRYTFVCVRLRVCLRASNLIER